MRLLSPLTAGIVSSAVLLVGLAAPSVAAPAQIQGAAPVVSVSAVIVPHTTAFKAKTVKALVPTKFYYTKNIKKTTIISTRAKTVTAKGTSSAVFVKINGNWKKVPYVYVKRTNTLKYDEGLRIKYGMAKDPLGASKAANMYQQDGGGVQPGTPPEDENPTRPGCDPTSQPCNYIPGGGVSVVTGSYDTNPAAVGIAGGNFGGEALAGINNVRAGAGLPPLAWCPAAAQAATGWANYMSSNNVYAHVANGSDPGSRMVQVGVSLPFGENFAAGYSNAGQAVNGWINSPSHLAMMKHPYATHVGIGIAPSPVYGGVVWVANFAGRGGACQ